MNHPNVCSLYDVGRQDGIDFLVLEYLDGETLAERLARGLDAAVTRQYYGGYAPALEDSGTGHAASQPPRAPDHGRRLSPGSSDRR